MQQRVLNSLDLTSDISDEELLQIIDEQLIRRSRESYMGIHEKRCIKQEIFNSIRKLDILQELIEDKEITEIMVNGTENIFIERDGRIQDYGRHFQSKEGLEDVIQQIVSVSNRTVNESNPIVDARLADGSRVNVVLPPVAMNGPILTIRKFPSRPITIEKLIELNSITHEAAQFLKKLVIGKYNIFISGGTGSGKTTFLNILSNYIPNTERLITIEDSAELQIRNIPNLVRLEVRNANGEGKNGITIRDLIKASLRMRPDRILIGEVRDSAAIDFLQALNTGHNGSFSTGHANSAADMLIRLETLVLMGAEIPIPAIRRQIASAIDIIVHLGRLRDCSRRVLEIAEVAEVQRDEIILRTLYEFQEEGEERGKIIGSLKAVHPLYHIDKLQQAGIEILNE